MTAMVMQIRAQAQAQAASQADLAIDIPRLRALRASFFARRHRGLEELAAGVTMGGWLATIRELRAQMAPVAAQLPESAFVAPPFAAVTSEERWSAGQVVDHVRMAQASVMFPFIDRVSLPDNAWGARPEAPPDPRPLSRAEALDALHVASGELAERFARLASMPEPERTVDNQWFGPLGIRGILLFFAIHEYDHLGQLRVMG
jgi:hypothetical protein